MARLGVVLDHPWQIEIDDEGVAARAAHPLGLPTCRPTK
jgi:hypothetical protein